MMTVRGIWAQIRKEAKELRRSLVGLIAVLSWTGVSIVSTVLFFNTQHPFQGTTDAVYNYWNQLLVLSFPAYLYPAMIVAGDTESGRWDFLRGVSVPWSKMFFGKFLFVFALTGGLVLSTALIFSVAAWSTGFIVSGVVLSSDWPVVLMTSAGLVWFLLLPVVSQGLFFSVALPNRSLALIASLSFFFIATAVAGSLYTAMVAPLGSSGNIPTWSLVGILLSPVFMSGLIVDDFGLVRHTVTIMTGGGQFTETVGYPVLGGTLDYVLWVLAESAAFLAAAVLVFLIKERKR